MHSLSSDFLARAKRGLPGAKSGKRGAVGSFLYYLLRSGATPEQLGTSFEELRQLINDWDTEYARELLEGSRESARARYCQRCHSDVWKIRQYLARSGALAEDIGSSEEELQRLSTLYDRATVRRSIDDELGRESPEWARIGSSVRPHDIRRHLVRAQAIPEDVGSTEEDLRRAIRKESRVRTFHRIRDDLSKLCAKQALTVDLTSRRKAAARIRVRLARIERKPDEYMAGMLKELVRKTK